MSLWQTARHIFRASQAGIIVFWPVQLDIVKPDLIGRQREDFRGPSAAGVLQVWLQERGSEGRRIRAGHALGLHVVPCNHLAIYLASL